MFNQPNHLPMEIIDLTRKLDQDLPVYCEGSYSDPAFQIETWCTVAGQGYKVSRMSLGTQTGTHIDAPAHFVTDGAELEALPVEALIGPYYWLDPDQKESLRIGYQGQSILFLAPSAAESMISEETFRSWLELPCSVWVTASSVGITGQEPLYFHRELARVGKYLVEDLDEIQAARVRPGGEVIALPLRLSGASGSPCRVIVRQPPGE